MSQEADITRMHAEWMERKTQIQREHQAKLQHAEQNFNASLSALDSELRGDLEETRQTLTQERDAIFSQLDMVFQRRLKDKEAILEEKRNLHLDQFRKHLDSQRQELAEVLDKTLGEHEMDYFKIMRPGGPSHSSSRPASIAPSAPSTPAGVPTQHRPQHHPQPSVPGRPPLQPAPAPAPAPVLAQPRQPPLQPNPQQRSGHHGSFAMPPQNRTQQSTQLQAPQPFQPHQQPMAPMARPGAGHAQSQSTGLGHPQAHQAAHQPGPVPSQHERRPLARVPTLPSQHPPTPPAPPKQTLIAPAQQQPHPERRQLPQERIERPAERPAERPIERPAERPVERAAERTMSRPVERPMQPPVERPTERPAERPAERPVERPVGRPADPIKAAQPVPPVPPVPAEQPGRPERTALLTQARKSPSADSDIPMTDSPPPVAAPPPLATRRSASMSTPTPVPAASVRAAATSAVPSETADEDSQQAQPERRYSRRQSSNRDVTPVPAPGSRPESRGRERALSLGHKRRGSSLSTPQRTKKPRNNTPPPAPASEKPLRPRRLPSAHAQWISFDEVYQNGKATFKHFITDWPPGNGVFYIMKCNDHGVHFNNTNPVSGAAKHLNGKDHHHLTKDRKQAVELLGWHVYDCTPELAAKNNEVVNQAFSTGYKIFTQKDRYFREMYNPDGTPRSDAQRAELAGSRRGPRGSIGPSKGSRPSLGEIALVESPKAAEPKPTNKEHKGVTDAVPGEIYYGYWTKNKMKYAVVVCGWGDQKCIGLPGKTLGQLWPTLLNRAPTCYKVNKQTREIEGWAEGYEDEGPFVQRRAYAVQFFDKSRGVAWLQARHLSPFNMVDPGRPDDPDHPFNQAREFYAGLRGFMSFEEWEQAGAKHEPVTMEESASEYNTPGELPPEDNPDHGEPDEDMHFGVGNGHKLVEEQDDDEYNPDHSDDEDMEMEDALEKPAPTLSPASRPRSSREHRRGQSNVSNKTTDAGESKSEGSSASARKNRGPRSSSKPAPASAPVDTGSNVNEEQLFGRALEYLKNKKAQAEKEKQEKEVAESKPTTPTGPAHDQGSTDKPSTSAPSSQNGAERQSLGPADAPASAAQAEQTSPSSTNPKPNGTGLTALNGAYERAASTNGTPIIRSLNGTPASGQSNGTSSAPGTPRPINIADAGDRWKAINSRTSSAAPAATETEAALKVATSTPAVPAPSRAGVVSPSVGTASPISIKTEINSSTADTYFDIAGYSGVDGEWVRKGEELSRLYLNDDNGVAETEGGNPLRIKVDPLLVVRVALEPMGDRTKFYLYGTKGVLHKLVFVACTDSQGRLQQPRILGRRFLKWVRNRNPNVPMPGAGTESVSRRSSTVQRTPLAD
ncbi:hypothetical protein MKZ38_005083 [Zalerion maritima]|uniref:Uncharacterized protein n=1 Tax=Zalerion maritima TaxID=339359 RepID=A0AAD5RKM4_9PEZI|nr:hypothetical protein MKZ38_005083 [Zalerion maritima]